MIVTIRFTIVDNEISLHIYFADRNSTWRLFRALTIIFIEYTGRKIPVVARKMQANNFTLRGNREKCFSEFPSSLELHFPCLSNVVVSRQDRRTVHCVQDVEHEKGKGGTVNDVTFETASSPTGGGPLKQNDAVTAHRSTLRC